jgi:D-alanyl-D-alanine carboxypeptidase
VRWKLVLGRPLMALPVALVLGAMVAVPAPAYHFAQAGWAHQHRDYPPKPYGYSQIVGTFGQPCSDNARHNYFEWRAADNGVWYPVRFHRKLGHPYSTNLDNDVKGHIINNHLGNYIRHGIYGYNCRYIDGTRTYSTHAWGIAVDVSSAEEWNGKCHSTVNQHHDQIWRNHGWTWGLAWCDPMHFQYASGY